MADFEWDPEKDSINIRKHRIDFDTAKLIWTGTVLERVDSRRQYGEIRFQGFGVVEGRVLTVIFTWRGATRRIISARKANIREKRLFETEIRKPPSN